MKKIYQIFIALLTISASLKGQVTVTATGGAFSGAYPTLKAAFDAINNGDHQGAINIRINASIRLPLLITVLSRVFSAVCILLLRVPISIIPSAVIQSIRFPLKAVATQRWS